MGWGLKRPGRFDRVLARVLVVGILGAVFLGLYVDGLVVASWLSGVLVGALLLGFFAGREAGG